MIGLNPVEKLFLSHSNIEWPDKTSETQFVRAGNPLRSLATLRKRAITLPDIEIKDIIEYLEDMGRLNFSLKVQKIISYFVIII